MPKLRHVVLMVREASRGFPESCQPLTNYKGEPILYGSLEEAEKAAAIKRRIGSLTPGTYLRNTTFRAGWLPDPF